MLLRLRDYMHLDFPETAKARTHSGRLVDLNLGRWLHDNASDLHYAEANIVKDANGEKVPGLEVTLEATASDVLINRRIYTGSSVKKRHPTFRGKPIGKFHSDAIDPVGRIVSSKFEQFLSGTDFENAHLNPALQKDGKIKGQPSGRIIVKSRIMDADAIDKIQDGRLSTVSQEGRASSAKCSICGQDWLKDGFCHHPPGHMCDVEDEDGKPTGKKKLAFLIVDIEVYDGLDFVKTPAWSQAMVLEVGDSHTVSHTDELAVELNRTIQDEILPDLPHEQLVCRARDVILYDALGEPLTIIEDGKPILPERIMVTSTNKGSESTTDSTETEPISDLKENKDMELEAKIKELEGEIADLKKQVKVTTDNLEKTTVDADKLKEDIKAMTAERDGLRDELQKRNAELVKRDAEEIVQMKETLGKIEFEDADEKKKYLEDLLSKDRGYLQGILDTIRPEFAEALKEKNTETEPANELADKAGALKEKNTTKDSPNVPATKGEEDDDFDLLK